MTVAVVVVVVVGMGALVALRAGRGNLAAAQLAVHLRSVMSVAAYGRTSIRRRCAIGLAAPGRRVFREELRSRVSMTGLRSRIQWERIGRGHGRRRRATSRADQHPVAESEVRGIRTRGAGRIAGRRAKGMQQWGERDMTSRDVSISGVLGWWRLSGKISAPVAAEEAET